MKRLLLTLFLAASTASAADEPKQDAALPPKVSKDSVFAGRKLDTSKHGVVKEWGYAKPQQDTFLVLHPKDAKAEAKTKTPLYVVLHSAGHDVHTCLACTTKVGNHDIYHTPEGFFGLYLDCRANMGDWWWGINTYPGPEFAPTEKRVVDTVKWVVQQYGLDENRVYLCGNSMGGSGTLGIGMRHGDLFAAIKANVPAGVKHVGNRMHFTEKVGETKFADPPVAIDYSAPNDGWAKGHEGFAKAMNDRKYSLILYWGPFGHANDHRAILKVNDLIDSFDWLQVKKNELYPVFTNASTNDPLPWPEKLDDKKAGQVNAFFRWKHVSDTPEKAEVSLRLLSESDVKTKFALPKESTADVTLRRLQRFQVKPGETIRWTFGSVRGETKADEQGLVTIPQLSIATEPAVLILSR
ncbi:MAG: prolyl oligopeptidase family serine peptidase [Gemmataceae bacterium]